MKKATPPQVETEGREKVTITLPQRLVQRIDQEVGQRRAARRKRPDGRPGVYARADLLIELLDPVLPALKA